MFLISASKDLISRTRFGLSMVRQEHAEGMGPSPRRAVDFEAAFGRGTEFTCSRVEIVDAIPCSADGIPLKENLFNPSG
jgi:hypothetical protein